MKPKTVFTTGLLTLISDKVTPDEIREMDYASMPQCVRNVIHAFHDLHQADRCAHREKVLAPVVIDLPSLQNEIKNHVFENQQAAVAAAMAEDGDEKFDPGFILPR